MPSPFPGMDPYLEDLAFWSDFHDSFIVYWSDALNDALPENYEARISGRSYVSKLDITDFEEVRETYIEIRRRPERTVVAVLELLSPSNKSGTDRLIYLDRRNVLLHQDVHLVELDLLLAGHRVPLEKPLPPGDYCMIVSRWERRPLCDAYAWSVRSPLPTLPIPLQAPDTDILTDFAAVFTTTFDRGRYARALAYGGPPTAPLREEDRAWAGGLLKPNP